MNSRTGLLVGCGLASILVFMAVNITHGNPRLISGPEALSGPSQARRILAVGRSSPEITLLESTRANNVNTSSAGEKKNVPPPSAIADWLESWRDEQEKDYRKWRRLYRKGVALIQGGAHRNSGRASEFLSAMESIQTGIEAESWKDFYQVLQAKAEALDGAAAVAESLANNIPQWRSQAKMKEVFAAEYFNLVHGKKLSGEEMLRMGKDATLVGELAVADRCLSNFVGSPCNVDIVEGVSRTLLAGALQHQDRNLVKRYADQMLDFSKNPEDRQWALLTQLETACIRKESWNGINSAIELALLPLDGENERQYREILRQIGQSNPRTSAVSENSQSSVPMRRPENSAPVKTAFCINGNG